jgi:exosortase C (VPDSG-CTERM-specific)
LIAKPRDRQRAVKSPRRKPGKFMPAVEPVTMTEEKNRSANGRWRRFFLASAILALCFGLPLFHLLWFAVHDELYSYIPLIPIISAYLVWTRRQNLPAGPDASVKTALIFFACGFATIVYRFAAHFNSKPAAEDSLALTTLAFLFFFTGAAFLFLGRKILRAVAFPVALLVFMVPLPVILRNAIETFLQYGSVVAASGLFAVSGLPYFRDGLVFDLPGINLQVAPECSGIHSTVVLLITSLVAGFVFLRSSWKRTLLCLAVIPLALLRNGFRIFVIGQLCARISPDMINSPVHRHGGPLFFLLSLIPFFLLLIFLIKSERRGVKSSMQTKI